MGSPARREIRFALVYDPTDIRVWQQLCLSELLAVPGLRLASVGVLPARVCRNRSGRSRRGPRSLRAAELADGVAGVARRQSADDVNWSRLDLDFILAFSHNTKAGAIASAARWGVWSFLFGGRPDGEAERMLFWSVYHGDPVVAAALCALTAGPDSRPAANTMVEATFAVDATSFHRTVDKVCFECARWPARLARRLLAGAQLLGQLGVPAAQPSSSVGAASHGMLVAKTLVRSIKGGLQSLLIKAEWNVGIALAPPQAFLNPATHPEIRWLPRLRRGGFLADPFVAASPRGTWLLCEDYDYARGEGSISSVMLGPDLAPAALKPAIQLSVHASYPYLVQSNGHTYCVPETAHARTITLFEADEHFQNWKAVATLLSDIAAVDSTVFEHGGRWWLFCTLRDHEPNMNLFIWHAPALFGPWTRHAIEPVKMDVRSARPGGTPFLADGQLIRPAQDCSTGYGGRLALNRVLRLTPEEFAEETVAYVRPDPSGPYPDGLHTLSWSVGICAVDGLRRRFVTAASWRSLRKAFTRKRGQASRLQSDHA